MNLDSDTEVLTARRVQDEYARGKQQNERTDLYEQVKLCERFYEGDQWNGLKTITVRPLTMNFLRRVVSYFSSMIVSDDIGFEIRPFCAGAQSGEADTAAQAITAALKRIIERQKLKAKNRESLRDASVDGDSALYFWFDPDAATGADGVQGEIVAENIMNTNILFGNPYSAEVQEQPHLLIVRRRPVQEVRREAKENGVQDWERIKSDNASEYKGEEDTACDNMTTEILRFWKKTEQSEDGKMQKRVWFCRVCGEVVLQEPTETGMTLYPVSYWSWLPKKNSCHGVRPMDEVINTQIAVNRLWTAIQMHIENLAFPKIVYDKSKFPKGWDATPGRAIAVTGSVQDAITNQAGGVPLNAMITNVLEMMISTARDFMGASDAALGNIKNPDNQSAIIAVQKASSAPLELQKLAFYQFVEDYIRILIDMMHAYYGMREVRITRQTADLQTGESREETAPVLYDFGALALSEMDLNVEIGEASYWSELLQITNANNLLAAQILPDAITYLESMPDGLIKNKAKLIEKLRAQTAAPQGAQSMSAPQEAAPQALPNGMQASPLG